MTGWWFYSYVSLIKKMYACTDRGGGAILPHLGHYKNDTVWPYFDQRALGFKNMAHTGILRKKLEVLEA